MADKEDFPNGEAAAAILASGIGSLALGVVTSASEVARSLILTLVFYRPVGPLSGRTTLAVIVWLASWLVLHASWRGRRVDFSKVFVWTMILVALGLVGTFPPPFETVGDLLRCLLGMPSGKRAL
jgi:hypothetical protein